VGPDFGALLTAVSGREIACKVRTLRARGVVVVLRDAALRLPLGERYRAVFSGGGLLRTYETAVRVDGRQEDDGGRLFLLGPEDPETFEREFVEPFHRGGLRRRSARASPDPADPPTVGLGAAVAGPFLPARVSDLSLDGMRIFVRAAEAASLASADRLWVRFAPPGAPGPRVFCGEVRHAHVVADQFAFGVRIDFSKTPEASRAEDALVSYVMKLQQRLLAERSERPEFEDLPEE
jgi:hypothetical protein